MGLISRVSSRTYRKKKKQKKMDNLLASEISPNIPTPTQKILLKLSSTKTLENDSPDLLQLTTKIHQICQAYNNLDFTFLLNSLIQNTKDYKIDQFSNQEFDFNFCKRFVISIVIKLIMKGELKGKIDQERDMYVVDLEENGQNIGDVLNRAVSDAERTNRILLMEGLRKSAM